MPIRPLVAALCLLAVVAACERGDRRPAPASRAPVPLGPVATLEQRLEELRANDLAGFSRRAVPPALYGELDTAWRRGEARWPLTALPLDERLPGLLATLSAPQAERALAASYTREFAGAHTELRAAAETLGTLGARYLHSEGDYSANERDHYLQLVEALVHWGRAAPLGEPARARHAIALLTAAARRTGLDDDAALSRTGMQAGLKRLGPLFGEFKRVLAGYGLDVDAALAGAHVEPADVHGDRAQVRLRYALGGRRVEALLAMERIDGHWYLSDVLRHARAQRGMAWLAKGPEPAVQAE